VINISGPGYLLLHLLEKQHFFKNKSMPPPPADPDEILKYLKMCSMESLNLVAPTYMMQESLYNYIKCILTGQSSA
jgi:hypothetical protein